MRSSIIFTALSALTVAVAQNNFTVDPNKIDATTRSMFRTHIAFAPVYGI